MKNQISQIFYDIKCSDSDPSLRSGLSMQIKCTQCGADVTVQQDETFIECPFCASALFLDKRKVVFHYLLNSNFKPNEAEGNLKRWMAGNHTVKDLSLIHI